MTKLKFLICVILIANYSFSQEKNFIDKPYIDVIGRSDTLVTPNKIFLEVLILEKDTKGKISVEELESKMLTKLKENGVNIEKNVTVQDILSNFKKYFLKQTDIQKSKSYYILMYDAKTIAKVIIGLEEIGISNVSIDRLEHSESEKIQLLMNSKAILNAKKIAESLLNPLNKKPMNILHIGYNIMNTLSGKVSGVTIRGNQSVTSWSDSSSKYETNLEFEKINISCSIHVKFSID